MTSRQEVAACIDHTLLAPAATVAEAQAATDDAVAWGCAAVCLSPWLVPAVTGRGVVVCTVVGFPSGAHASAIKAEEAARAAAAGAGELDMVVNLGLVKAGDWGAVVDDVRAVREAIPGRVLKVIVESAALDDRELARVTEAAVAAGADYVKTSTGFHPAGGATVHAVEVIVAHAGGRGVKASGGIRTADQALAMLAAGATRLGCSATAAILGALA